jgi:hypothetical protein
MAQYNPQSIEPKQIGMQIIYQKKLVTFATIKSGRDQTISICLLQVNQFLILFYSL